MHQSGGVAIRRLFIVVFIISTIFNTTSVIASPTQYTITAAAGDNGSIEPAGEVVAYQGDNKLFTATANPGYLVGTWYLDGNNIQQGGNTLILYNIQTNHNVLVTFLEPLYVDANSPNNPGSGTESNPFRHIQDGINAAMSGIEVHVAGGTYYEWITMKNGVNLYGGYDGRDWNAPRDCNVHTTIIWGSKAVVAIIDSNVTIDGFTIQYGHGYGYGSPSNDTHKGGGIYCASNNKTAFTVRISNNIIQNNTLTDAVPGGYGAGIYCDSYVKPVIVGNIIRNNNITINQANMAAGAGIYYAGLDCNISGNVIVDNRIDSMNGGWYFSHAEGGGIWVGGGFILDNTVLRNSVSASGHYGFHHYVKGGGIYCDGPATIIRNHVEDNELYCRGKDNDGGETSETYGGGIYAPNSEITFNSVNSNSCTGEGGYIYQDNCDGASGMAFGGGIYAPGASLANNLVANNDAFGQGSDGGSELFHLGYSSQGGDGIAIGGGIYAPGATIINNTVADNQTVASFGKGYLIIIEGRMGVHDPNHDGAAISEAAGIYVDSNSVITNTIVWNNSPDQLHGQDCNKVTYSDINDDICSNGLGNILADPLFVNPANKDYHLKSAAGRWDPNSQSWVYDNVISPCIDAGDPNSDWTAELWPHGNRINMGAYGGTAQASMSLSKVGNLADLNRDNFVDIDDLVLLFSKWLTEKSLLVEDLNLDGVVDFRDYAIFAENWLQRSYVIIAKFALDINPGWTTQGQWQFGPPMGMGGLSHGYPDPNAAYTGQNVYGVNLNGDYTVAVGGALLFNSRSFQLPAILRYQVEICQVAKYR